MNDASGREIIPKPGRKLTMKTNRHYDTSGNSFGWIEGCTRHIVWSNGSRFNEKVARKFVNDWNAANEDAAAAVEALGAEGV